MCGGEGVKPMKKAGLCCTMSISQFAMSKNAVKQYAAIARYLKMARYLYQLNLPRYNPSHTVYWTLKHNSQSSTQTKIKLFYCTKFVIVPVKDFCLVREMQEFTTEFSKWMFLKTFLLVVHLSYTVLLHRKMKKKNI